MTNDQSWHLFNMLNILNNSWLLLDHFSFLVVIKDRIEALEDYINKVRQEY